MAYAPIAIPGRAPLPPQWTQTLGLGGLGLNYETWR